MLRDRGLLQPQSRHNVTDRALLQRKIVQYLAPPRLGNGVEGVRSSSSSCHAKNITFPYRNMSSVKFQGLSETQKTGEIRRTRGKYPARIGGENKVNSAKVPSGRYGWAIYPYWPQLYLWTASRRKARRTALPY